MFDYKTLKEAMDDAERFLHKARAAQRILLPLAGGYSDSGSKEVGACKRASMDLTRALVPLRH